MARADSDLTFGKSEWFSLKTMQKEQREDQRPGWWPLREAQGCTHCKGDKNNSPKVLISVKITTVESKEVIQGKYGVYVQTGDNCFQTSWQSKLSS